MPLFPSSVRIQYGIYCVLLLTFSLNCLIGSVFCNHYLNIFAVHIPGGNRVARDVAETYGYKIVGQIGSLEDHYLFENPHVHRRSVQRNQEHHKLLSSHPQIQWFEQQKVLSRRKRDFIAVPINAADLLSSHLSKHDIKRAFREDFKFNDELFQDMWYFNGGGFNHTDMNVMGAWKKGVTGKNIVITILDDGIERTHDDLIDNYDPYASTDINGHDSDPMPRYEYTNENRHGTRCAGEVSAKANNTKCVVGVAYNSKIGGVRMLDGNVYDAVEAAALSHNRSHIDIYSASWGPDDDGRVVDGPGPLAQKAFIDGIRLGRLGKGSIYVWASGNGGLHMDSCNCDGYTNSIYTLSISSISQHGNKPWYLEECSSTLAATLSSGAYSEKQIVTVDLHNQCTETHTGTSASAPLAAGIVALVLQVNAGLTWRDVQYITLMTAQPVPDGLWETNGVGRKVSLRYGYGLMDATAMVDLAEKWTNVPNQHICEIQSTMVNRAKAPIQIPDSRYEEILDTDACAGKDNAISYLEHVQARITIKSKRRGDLVIHLISPSKTKSTILSQRPYDIDSMKGFDNWVFLSVHFWGENPVGQWKLQIECHSGDRRFLGSQTTNDLIDWSLILYGTEQNPLNFTMPTHLSAPSGSIKSNGTCHSQCVNGCTGTRGDQCTACRNYKLHGSGTCVESCPNNFYSAGFICKECNTTCETCTSVSAGNVVCLKCKSGYLLVEDKGTCEVLCEKGYCLDNISHSCHVCSEVCAECDGNKDQCTACRDGQHLADNTCVTVKDQSCPADQYRKSVEGCVPCPDGCFSCDSDTDFTFCDKGCYRQNGSCVNSCSTGFLPFQVNFISQDMFQQCQYCGDNCSVCPDGFLYLNGTCVQQSNCPQGTYFNWNSMECQSCNPSCKACIGASDTDFLACFAQSGYNSLLRKCMHCCTDLRTRDCCSCIEDGKCEMTLGQDTVKKLFHVTSTIVVLVIIVVCLTTFVIVVIVICWKKKKPFANIIYKNLQNEEIIELQ